ncbi:MAG: DUF4390 domain-containing protein [Acidobacteriota bacterium]
MIINLWRLAAILLVCILLCITATNSAADGIIHNIKTKLTDSELLVSYQLRGAMDITMWRMIDAGEQTRFNYDVQLIEERRFWFDHKLAQLEITNSVKLDTLTHQYHLLRHINGEMVDTKITTRPDDVEHWLTEVDNLRVIGRSGLAPRGHYLLQVRAHLKSDFIFYIVPWEVYTPWESIGVRIP